MFRNYKPSRQVVLTTLCLVSAAMCILPPSTAGALRAKFHWLLAPVGHATMYAATSFKEVTRSQEYISQDDAHELKRENEILRTQLEAMETDLLTMWNNYQRGNATYSKLFGASRNVPVRFINAKVVAADSLPYGWTRVVNEGTKKGATGGMYVTQRRVYHNRSKKLPENLPVLAGSVLVGRITESGAYTSRLQLLTDEGFKLNGQIKRVIDPTRPRQIRYRARMQTLTPQNNLPVEVFATGDGGQYLKLTEVKKIHNIRPGDQLHTRNDNGALPAIVPVGEVIRVSDDPHHAGMVEIVVRPYADMASLRDVSIVVPVTGKLAPIRRGGGR